jgi:hypothetical protein
MARQDAESEHATQRHNLRPSVHRDEKELKNGRGPRHPRPMKILRGFVLLLTVAVAAGQAAEPGFWQQLTPEERRAAGLDRLTPEQQAALDQMVGRFSREGARQVREQARQDLRAEVKEEVRAEVKQEVRAEVKQEVRAEVKREVKAEEKTVTQAKAGLPEEKHDEVIRSRIVGEFNGWSGASVFHLENGQVWAQSNSSDTIWLPTMVNPEIEIRPSKLGGWKLYVSSGGYWVRVRRVK